MKIKTAEQYADRFKRISSKWRKTRGKDLDQTLANLRWLEFPHITQIRDINYDRKPNHILRAVSIDTLLPNRPVQPNKPYIRNVGGFRLVGTMGRCDRVVVGWVASDEVIATKDGGSRLETTYTPFAYPCVVDHGMKRLGKVGSKHIGFIPNLVPNTGEKGEHRDATGRVW